MKIFRLLYCLLVFPLSVFPAQDQILKIVVDGNINPVSANFISSAIDIAERDHYNCLLIH
jgi:membrane-bound ClpP family serine protease